MSVWDVISKGNAEARGSNRAHNRTLEAIDMINDQQKRIRAWNGYAQCLRASLDAERQAEADIMAELRRLDPANPLADPKTVDNLSTKYYKLINDNDNKNKVNEQIKPYMDREGVEK